MCSERDWLRLSLRLSVFEMHLKEKLAHIDAMRCISAMTLTDTGQGVEERQNFAVEGVERYRGALMPWTSQKTRQTTGDATDDLLDWYALFRPDLLKEAMNG